jgi:hypothetical protein
MILMRGLPLVLMIIKTLNELIDAAVPNYSLSIAT